MKEGILNLLNEQVRDLKDLRRGLKRLEFSRVNRKEYLEKIREFAMKWFENLESPLKNIFGVPVEILDKYNSNFRNLLRLCSPNNLKKSYIIELDVILKDIKREIIIPVQQYAKEISVDLDISKLLDDLKNEVEKQYLNEAISCAGSGFLRASIVLGWCAVIDRIHKKIDKIGFQKFNEASEKMKNQTSGRYKKFNKSFKISNISELRGIFDTDILWIIEYLDLIDSNQHTRLRNCFDMRNNCAHPGEAPITKPNLVSFYSDITEIIFRNPKFDV